jgi:hypothetical protein
VNECETNKNSFFHLHLIKFFSVKLRENDTTPELAEPYFYYGQALLYLGLGEQQVFGSDIVKG